MPSHLSLDGLGHWPPLDAGRAPAGRILLDWARDPKAERLCLVGGSPGVGKSHLLAWFVAHGADQPATRVHALIRAAGMTPSPMLWDLASQLGWTARTVSELLTCAAKDRRPLLIVLADFHHAAINALRADFQLVTDVLEPLLQKPWVRIIAEVQTVTANPFTTAAATIDLDDRRLTDPDEYAYWYDHLYPDGLPRAPANVAYPNPALGQLASQISNEHILADLAASENKAHLLSAAWWTSLDAPARRALGTLARTRGPIGRATWRALHCALHPQDPDAAIDVDAAIGRLTRPGPDLPEQTFSLPALAELCAPADASADSSIFGALVSLVPTNAQGISDWGAAPQYVLDHIAGHAAPGEEAERLLSDPGFLVHGSAQDISGLLDRPGVTAPPALRAVWAAVVPVLNRAGGDLGERAAILHAGALGRAPRLAKFLAPAAERHSITARWSRMRRRVTVDSGPARGERWPGAVRALSLFASMPPRSPWLIAADPLGQLRRVDVYSGTAVGRVINSYSTPVTGLAYLGGETWAVLDTTGAVRPVSAGAYGASSTATSSMLDTHQTPVTCLGGDPQGHLVVFGDASGTAVLHELSNENGRTPPPRRSARLADAAVTAICCLSLADGRAIVFGAAANGAVFLWAPPDLPSSIPLWRRASVALSLAAAHTAAGAVLVAAWADGLVELRGMSNDGALSFHPHHAVAAVALTSDGLLVGAGDEAITGWQCDLSLLTR